MNKDLQFWLMIIGMPLIIFGVIRLVFYPALKPSFMRRGILRHGFAVQGTVLEIEETGIWSCGFPQVRVGIVYLGDDGFERQTTATIFQGIFRRAKCGIMVDIVVDRRDPSRCVLV